MFAKKFIILALAANASDAFHNTNTPNTLSKHMHNNLICRRHILNILTKAPVLIPFTSVAQPSENRPLTPAEMEEYNKLLEEAKRIRSIIDTNINASKKLLMTDEENDLEKYIRENKIQKHK